MPKWFLTLLALAVNAAGPSDAAAEGILGAGPTVPGYYVSCEPETSSPAICQSIAPMVRLDRQIGFNPSFSFIVEAFVAPESGLMSGYLVNQAGRVINRDEAFAQDQRDILYVESADWDCILYRGDRRWPA